ncbi:hypothetical protein GCM10010531_22250 [Blastococcus jejuensis]|uniref:DUF1440 domain-containing protein n=1 Tax=Blastococcus jejuensis TaxID=351224 RepID=A0ABP6P6D1_9ACTN
MASRRTDLVTGALAGYAASRTMDAATTAFYARQDEASKRREQDLAPGGTLRQLGQQLAAAVGRDVDDAAAARIGVAVHRSLGVGYGVLAAALVRRGWSPWAAGLTVGAGAFLVVDEGTSLSQAADYPLVSHLRGVVGHATYALAAGALLAARGPAGVRR